MAHTTALLIMENRNCPDVHEQTPFPSYLTLVTELMSEVLL